MSEVKRSRKRWHSGHDILIADSLTIQQLKHLNHSFENETVDEPKSSGAPLTSYRTKSDSSSKTRNGRRNSKQISDEVDSGDNLTYTKYDSDANKKNVESPVNSVLKVQEYLLRHEKQESVSPDNNQVRRQKRRKAKKQKKDNCVLESKRSDHHETYDENDRRPIEDRESDTLCNNDRVIRHKQRKEESHALELKKTEEDKEMYDEDGRRSMERRESESSDNNQLRRHEQRKLRKQRKEESRVLESERTGDNETYEANDRPPIEKRESDSPDNNKLMREERRKSKKKRKEKTRVLESNRIFEDDAYDEDVKRKSKKVRSDESRISGRRKRRRSKTDSFGGAERREEELPITEILRKAQENSRNRSEVPVSFPELTTDTIYVQRRNGFSAVKISGDRNSRSHESSRFRGSTLYPIKVAIAAQKVWTGMGLIHQGLLAGMALMHILLIQTFFELSLDFLIDYSLISELYANIFSFLITMCVVSVFDKFDLAHLDLEHTREIYVEHSQSFIAIPLYVATFCLHQASLLVDDKISLLNYTGNATGFENNSTETIVEEHFLTWQKVILAKDSLAVLAWLFVALGPREDMLLTHLKSMEKYADTPESSWHNIEETMRGSIRNM